MLENQGSVGPQCTEYQCVSHKPNIHPLQWLGLGHDHTWPLSLCFFTKTLYSASFWFDNNQTKNGGCLPHPPIHHLKSLKLLPTHYSYTLIPFFIHGQQAWNWKLPSGLLSIQYSLSSPFMVVGIYQFFTFFFFWFFATSLDLIKLVTFVMM